MFAILFCFVQNKFVFCKAIVGFYFGIVRDDVFGCYRFQKNNMFLIVSKMEIFEKVSCSVLFRYRELRRFSNNTSQRL